MINLVNVKVGGVQDVIRALQNYNTIILKPNIVDNRNVLTQDMINEKHTKYIIKWNYILEGATINVPEDCIIEFAGGTIDNGVIVGNNTRLIYSKPIDEICKAERQGTWIYDTSVADEEDITSVEGHLKFKDRPATDGMGKIILRKNKSFASQVTQPNTIYVIQYNFDLNGEEITVPENCVFEFEGGSLSNVGDIILGKNVKFVGENYIIYISGTIKLNIHNYIDGAVFIRLRGETDYINKSLFLISSSNLSLYKNTTANLHLTISNIRIEDDILTQNPQGNVFEIVSFGDWEVSKGFWGITFDNIYIDGYFDKAFYIHNEVSGDNNGWITDVTFNRCMIMRSKTGWKLESNSSFALQKINILDCSMLCHSWVMYMLDCGFANRVNVKNCEAWDWHTVQHNPFKFYKETGDVYIDFVTASKYDYESSTDENYSNKIHIDNYFPNAALLTDFIDLTNPIKLVDLYNLPDNIYNLPQDSSFNSTLGFLTNQGGVMQAISSNGLKIIIVIGNVTDTQNKKEYAFMAFERKPSSELILSEDYWSKPLVYTKTNRSVKSTKENLYFVVRTFDEPSGTTFPNSADFNKGAIFINTTYVIPAVSLGNKWTLLMERPESLYGDTRPSYQNTVHDRGFYFLDSSINKPIYWNGTKWIESDGATAGVSRSGAFANKPASTDIYVGFQYFNTGSYKMITWDGTKWYNPDGTEAVS